MKLWQKNITVDEQIDAFTVGKDREMDLYLAAHDVAGSLAHIAMLQHIGLLNTEEWRALKTALKTIYQNIQTGHFEIQEGMEDVHSQVEWLLTEQLGEVGKKIHSGRSRNDQVLVDIRLFLRAEITEIAKLMQTLFCTLQQLSEKHKTQLLPGYTHTQVAMVSSFGLWFGAYAETLADDLLLLQAVYKINNQNPLGSAAGFGSSFPLNRTLTTQLLGFDDLNYNVVHAQMGRGKTERFLSFAIASIAATLNKLAADVCLYMSQNFAFISFPAALTTGSSIMPHKKNPDVFELIRAKCSRIQALPNEVALLTNNLISGYHRDFQLLKEAVFPFIIDLKDCLRIADFALQHIEVKSNILESRDDLYRYLYSVEEVNKLVLAGIPFRDAYRQVGQAIENGDFQPDRSVQHTHEGSMGNLCTDAIRAKWERNFTAFDFQKADDAIQRLLA